MDSNMNVEGSRINVTSPEQARKAESFRNLIERKVLGAHPTPTADFTANFIDLTAREKADLLYQKLMAFSLTQQMIKEEGKQNPDVETNPVDPDLVGEIKALWEDPKAQDLFVSRATEARLEAKVQRLSELGKNWRTTNEKIATASEVFATEARRLFLQKVTRPDQVSAAQGRTERVAKELIKLRQQKEDIFSLKELDPTSENTDIAAAIMFDTLSEYHHQADQGFVWLPSRQGIHEQTIASLQNGRWPVLRGEAGTGKSEQADAAAVALTGEQPTHLACGPNTGYKEMIADKDIDPATGGSYETYGPAMQAATGFIDSRGRQVFTTGRIVRFDESGRLGPRGYTDIKELRQKRTANGTDIARSERGESIDPDKLLHGKPVLPGFAAILTTNPSGARYPDRNEPDAALRRELAYITVDYPPMSVENPELYEFMLATLMDGNKHIPVARKELAPAYETVPLPVQRLKNGRVTEEKQDVLKGAPTDPEHGVLYRLSFAIRALQDAYNFGNYTGTVPDSALRFTTDNDGKIKIAQTGGEPLTLSSSTITLGELSSWMRGFHERKLKDDPNYQVSTLTEWLQLKLNNYLNQADEMDRGKIRALFDHFHLFNAAPDLTKEEPLTPKEIGYLSPRVPRPLHLAAVSEAEEANIVPSGVIEGKMNDNIQCMLEDGTTVIANHMAYGLGRNGEYIDVRRGKSFVLGGERLQYVGLIFSGPDNKASIVARIDTGKPDEAIHRIISTEELEAQGVFEQGQEAAERLFGDDFFGPEQIEKAFGTKIDKASIPEIPFSQQELERAKELGQFLILRVEAAENGRAFTMKNMQLLETEALFASPGKGKILYDTSWCKGEDFFTKDKPRPKWALVSKDVIPNSTSKNYSEQTHAIAMYLTTQLFSGSMPSEYSDAILEFTAKQPGIDKLMTTDWQAASKALAELKLNQMTRQTPVEALYDLLVYFQNKGDRLLGSMYTWTTGRASDGRLVALGGFDSGGASVSDGRPDGSHPGIGVVLSR